MEQRHGPIEGTISSLGDWGFDVKKRFDLINPVVVLMSFANLPGLEGNALLCRSGQSVQTALIGRGWTVFIGFSHRDRRCTLPVCEFLSDEVLL